MNKSGTDGYLEKVSSYLFKQGLTGNNLDEKIEIIQQDLEDRFDENTTLDTIIEEFGEVETVIKEYNLPSENKEVSSMVFLRWIYLIVTLLIPTIFFMASISFFYYPISNQPMLVKILVALKSNLLFLLTFAYCWYNTKFHNWQIQKLSIHDPRYRLLKSKAIWMYILPLILLWTLSIGFISFSINFWQELASPIQNYVILTIKLVITTIAIYYLNLVDERQTKTLLKKNMTNNIIFFTIVLPVISSVAIFENLDFQLFEIITDQGSVGNTSYQSSLIVGFNLIFSLVWFSTPFLIAIIVINQVRKEQIDYQIPWLLGNLYIISLFIVNIFGTTFYNEALYTYYGEFAGEENLGHLSYGLPGFIVIISFILWNTLFSILHLKKYNKSTITVVDREYFSFNILRAEKLKVFVIVIFILVLISSPFANYQAELSFTSGTLDPSNFEQGNEVYLVHANEFPFAHIPQQGNVDIIFIVPIYSDFRFNLTWTDNDIVIQTNEEQFQTSTSENHILYISNFVIKEETVIKMSYVLGIMPGNPSDIEFALETYCNWSGNYVINGWITIWFGVIELVILAIYSRKDLV